MRFEHPFAAAVSFIIFLILYAVWNRRTSGRYFGFSDIRLFPARMPLRQMLIVQIPTIVFILISMAFFFALSGPKMKDTNKIERVAARDIVLVIDMSYSMQMALSGAEGQGLSKGGEPRKKIDTAKEVAVDFIGKRKDDRFGLMIFGDDAFGLWPMTTDHPVVSEKVSMLDTEEGYGFLGATNLVKAIDTGISYIEKDSEAEEPILIFISDGEGTAEDEDLNELISRLRRRNIHFYWILMEKNTAVKQSPIEKIVSNLKFGRRFSAVDDLEIKKAIVEIDQVEKTRTLLETSGDDLDLYPHVCLLAAAMVIGAVFLEGYRL
ncbi:MAG: VWA domain-containing protein [Desulfobacteraceae bacterium]|nr:MAG: VWA domain-containing protein [Desulfobacteraceae bacterium]